MKTDECCNYYPLPAPPTGMLNKIKQHLELETIREDQLVVA